MSGKRYTDEFMIEAVRQVTDQGYPVVEAAGPGVTTHRLYAWQKEFGPKQGGNEKPDEAQREARRLEGEPRRVTGEDKQQDAA